jgi:large subunit ribosomal protein L16
MLSPKCVKYRKPNRGSLKGRASCGSRISFGDYGLRALQPKWITARQIESRRRVLTRYVRRTGKLWIRIFPDKYVTARPAETRIGSGKGNPEYWVTVIRPGSIIFEICGVSKPLAKTALRIAASKLPVKRGFVTKVLF